ncbi:hypothetical protein COT76_01295 [Candidatus Berkelbacteria bacterium CG10_big_fil_rev_8_21_14_0_10_33_10]|nr:MAG: hypothetical protein COT76_01295 [Candidatus Berkelbacteria bacterium CG10_big_fil_rev_8_21_14_0_10_33_10]
MFTFSIIFLVFLIFFIYLFEIFKKEQKISFFYLSLIPIFLMIFTSKLIFQLYHAQQELLQNTPPF